MGHWGGGAFLGKFIPAFAAYQQKGKNETDHSINDLFLCVSHNKRFTIFLDKWCSYTV